MDLSNKNLAFLLVVAIVISLGGTIISLDKLNRAGFTGFATGSDVGTTNFSLTSNVMITFSTSLVNFGTGYVNGSAVGNYCDLSTNATFGWNNTGACGGGLKNTTPFIIRNDGNINVNLTLNASANATGFVTGSGAGGYATPWFNWSLSNNESNSCGTGLNDTTWTNVSQSNKNECVNFLYTDATDTIRLDIKLEIPVDATQVVHTATITATGTG